MARFFTIIALIASVILAGCGGGSHTSQNAVTSASADAKATATMVTLKSPQVGPSPTPLSVQATATSPNGISGWAVYLDDSPAFQGNPNSENLSVSVPVSDGSHNLYVRAWDNVTANFGTSPTMKVTVSGGQATISTETSGSTTAATPTAAPASSGPLPSVPDNAKVYDSIQDRDGWQSCSGCAGGGSTTSNFWTAAHQTTPSKSGSSREFFIGGHAWTNALWYVKVDPGQSWASHFLWDFWVRFDSTSSKHAHSAEYDMWQAVSGQEFMMGSQCNFESGVWDIWDSKNFRWVPTSAGCHRFSPDTWHHVQWYVERWGSHQYHYGVLVVDGEAHTFDRTFDTNSASWQDSVGVQFQLDQDSSGTPLHEWVDNVKLSIW